jgi:hypothetical protein
MAAPANRNPKCASGWQKNVAMKLAIAEMRCAAKEKPNWRHARQMMGKGHPSLFGGPRGIHKAILLAI